MGLWVVIIVKILSICSVYPVQPTSHFLNRFLLWLLILWNFQPGLNLSVLCTASVLALMALLNIQHISNQDKPALSKKLIAKRKRKQKDSWMFFFCHKAKTTLHHRWTTLFGSVALRYSCPCAHTYICFHPFPHFIYFLTGQVLFLPHLNHMHLPYKSHIPFHSTNRCRYRLDSYTYIYS